MIRPSATFSSDSSQTFEEREEQAELDMTGSGFRNASPEGPIRAVDPAARLDHAVPVPRDVLNSFIELVTTEDNCYWDHYRCPHCGDGVKFTTTDFNRHTGMEHSNLERSDRAEFDRARLLEGDEYFLDFPCPGCRAPVRVVYACIFVGKGSLHYVVRAILERVRWEGRGSDPASPADRRTPPKGDRTP